MSPCIISSSSSWETFLSLVHPVDGQEKTLVSGSSRAVEQLGPDGDPPRLLAIERDDHSA
jgi:hypothetical protein